MANLGQPINATLNYQPGGNPLLGYAGGVGGLAQQYGLDYNAYLNANQTNYNNITAGYNTVMQNVGNALGQGGTGWGVAQAAADDINSAARNAAGGAISRSISSGTGKSTAAAALQRGVLNTQGRALGALGNSLANTYAGYEAQIGQNQLNFMNSVNAPPPNAAAYGALAQQYGQVQQQGANNALQQQALQAQTRAANQAAAARGSGMGGVSIPSTPRGGTYGSGSGGFPSGGGVAPTATGANNPWANGGSGNRGGQGQFSIPVTSGPAGVVGYPGGENFMTPEDAAATGNYGYPGQVQDAEAGQSPLTMPGDWGLSGFDWGG